MSKLIRLREALCGLESEISRHEARLVHRCRLSERSESDHPALLRLAHIRQSIRDFLDSGQALVLAVHLRLDPTQFAHLSPMQREKNFHPKFTAQSERNWDEDAEYICDQIRAILCNWEAKLRFTPARIAIHSILAEMEVIDSPNRSQERLAHG